MMTSPQVVEMLVNVTTYSPSQDYTHLEDHTSLAYAVTPGLKEIKIEKNKEKQVMVDYDHHN